MMVLPTLFQLGPYAVGTHDFFVMLGVVAATIVFCYEAQRRAMLSEQLIWIVVGTLADASCATRAWSCFI